MTEAHKRSFRNYLINRKLQLHLISNIFIYMLIIVFVTVGIVLYPLIHGMMFSEDLDLQYQAAQTFLTLIKWLIPAVIILFILFMGHMIWTTHRICGPLINFTHTFDRLAEGDLTHKVYLRKGDYLNSECSRINLMIDGISGIIICLFDHHKKLSATLQALNEQVRDLDSKGKIESSLEIIKKDMEYISETLSSFKVEKDKTPGI
jgi:Methyl-accepting chemotaxis protein